VAVAVQIPGLQTTQPVACTLNDIAALQTDPTGNGFTPELFAVSKPYVSGTGSFSIDGQGFGDTQGQATLDGVALTIDTWSPTHLDVTVPVGTTPGPHQLMITTANGRSTVNGLTFHVLTSSIPQNGVLDDFNRPSGGLGTNWGGDGNTVGRFSIQHFPNANPDGVVQVRNVPAAGGNTWWIPTVFGADQEAFFSFEKLGSTATEQGLLLKFNGPNPNSNNATWIEVAYNGTGAVVVRTKVTGQNAPSAALRATFAVSFAANDRLRAITTADGTVYVYKNSSLVGSVNVTNTGPIPYWPLTLAQGSGSIGVRFVGTTSTNDARFDDFGGGNVTNFYLPTVYEVGSGYAYSTIQSALDAAASIPGQNALVVVYPGAPDLTNPRYNGRGVYYENIIMYSPVKLQGVGPGGVRADGNVVEGTIIDGAGFGGDTALTTDWLIKITSLTWDGLQDINDGQVIYVLASENQTTLPNQARQFGSAFKASIDGFEIRGGDQQGIPGNLNAIFGPFPGPLQALQVVTQGGAIFANGFARNLQITNNLVDGNGG
jgi:hypothetical protein